MTQQVIITALGALLLLVGILGGQGFELKEFKIGQLTGSVRLASLVLGFVFLAVGYEISSPPAPHQDAQGEPTEPSKIIVVAGTYGQNCGALYDNVKAHLESKCNGRAMCEYVIDYHIIGDPAVGCKKDYLAEWKCGDKLEVKSASASAEAGLGSKVTLSCP
jgi:hypothetical protein